jgi:hypothetical protein
VKKRKKTPAPPPIKPAILNESVILQQLRLPLMQGNLKLLRHAAPCAILDAFDRGAKREFVIELINAAIAVNEQCSRIQLLYQLAEMDTSAAPGTMVTIPSEQVQALAVDLAKSTEEYRGKVVELTRQLSEMPQEIDPIN